MKAGWQLFKLGDLTDLITKGTTPTSIGFDFTTNGVNFIKVESLTDSGDFIEHKLASISEECHQALARSQIKEGDILFSIAGALGRTAIMPPNILPANTNQALAIIRLKNDERILPKFIYKALGTGFVLEQVDKFKGGVAQQNLSLAQIKDFQIPIPPIQEQHRIVAILDQAFEGIAKARANAEQNLQNARALFESHLQSVFNQRGVGWVQKPLSDLCYIKHGFAFKSEFFSNEGSYVLLTPGNFYETGGYRDRGEKQKYYIADIPPDFLLNKGDLLVAMTEQAPGLLGSPILVPESDKFLHNQRLGLVTKKSGVPWINEFFFHVFNTKSVRKEIHDSASGVKVRHTSPTKIGEVAVSYPTSIAEQHNIVSTLKELSLATQRLVALYQRKIACLDELKKSLLQQAFAGEL